MTVTEETIAAAPGLSERQRADFRELLNRISLTRAALESYRRQFDDMRRAAGWKESAEETLHRLVSEEIHRNAHLSAAEVRALLIPVLPLGDWPQAHPADDDAQPAPPDDEATPNYGGTNNHRSYEEQVLHSAGVFADEAESDA